MASVVKLEILPLTPDRWPALEDLFGELGACKGCWCMYWRTGSEYRKLGSRTNKRAFGKIVKQGPPPGLIALVGSARLLVGAKLRRGMLYLGSTEYGVSGEWMMYRCGPSHAFTCAKAIAGEASHPRSLQQQ